MAGDYNTMESGEGSQESSTGLELDKFDLSALLQGPPTEKNIQKESIEETKEKSSSLNSANIKVALIIGAIILSLTFVYLLWDHTAFNIVLGDHTPTSEISKRIVSVGPVMTSFGKNEHVKMTVQIECKNNKLKNQVSRLNQRIQNNIVMMLNDPKAKQLLRRGDFESLKPMIKKKVERMLNNSGIEDVYFSQINLY